jgi:hypothetical protein
MTVIVGVVITHNAKTYQASPQYDQPNGLQEGEVQTWSERGGRERERVQSTERIKNACGGGAGGVNGRGRAMK